MRPTRSRLTLLALPALLGTAGAAPKISAQSIIVNPLPTSLGVEVWTDRTPGGDGAATYAPGDCIRPFTRVNQDACVYLFNVNPRGNVDPILPNRLAGGGNFLGAKATRVFPDAGDPFTFDIAAPYGLNKVLALAKPHAAEPGQGHLLGGRAGRFEVQIDRR